MAAVLKNSPHTPTKDRNTPFGVISDKIYFYFSLFVATLINSKMDYNWGGKMINILYSKFDK